MVAHGFLVETESVIRERGFLAAELVVVVSGIPKRVCVYVCVSAGGGSCGSLESGLGDYGWNISGGRIMVSVNASEGYGWIFGWKRQRLMVEVVSAQRVRFGCFRLM